MNKVLTIFLISVLFFSCSTNDAEEEEFPNLRPVSEIIVKDVSNFTDARDIQISFTKPNGLSVVEEFRIYIVPEDVQSSFDSSSAITETDYFTVTTNASSTNISFESSQTDVNGDIIAEGVPYLFFVMTIGEFNNSDVGVLSEPSEIFVLGQNNIVRTLTVSLDEGTGGMDTDAEGNIYVADFGETLSLANGSNVLKISPDGEVQNFADGFIGASGNDFDNEGNLYQSNIGGNTISKVTPDGTVTQFASGLNSPVGIAYDGDSNFYVCNCGNHTIAKLDEQGNVSTFSSGDLFSCPNGIDIDDEGNLYVANFSSSTIVKITPDGIPSEFATMPGTNNGHLLFRDDFIYVVSRGLHQIHKVSLQGEVSLVAGNGTREIVDGPVLEASFSLPNDIAFSPDGKYLYVNDVDGLNLDNSIISPSIIRVIELVEE